MSGLPSAPDLRALLTLAASFDASAETLRARASAVRQSPHAAGWYSSGARAFARSAEEAAAGLLVVARRQEGVALELRSLAAAITARGGGR